MPPPLTIRLQSSVVPRGRQSGLSLVEIMIALTLGLVLVLGMSFLIAEQSRDRTEIDRAGRQLESGRYAMSLLSDEIQAGGYYGEFGLPLTPVTTLPDPCELTNQALLEAAMAMPVQGYNAPTSGTRPSCIDEANHLAGTDILVIRRAATNISETVSTSQAGVWYLQTTPAARILALGGAATPYSLVKKDTTTPADIRRYLVQIYFVSPCNVPASGTTCSAAADNGRPIPTLKRLEINSVGGTATFVTRALVEGIENLQFDYNLDAAGTGVPTFPGVQAPALAEWPNVMSVNVHLLARNNEESIGHTDTKTYNLGLAGSVGPFNDNFKRHVYTGLVRVVNVSQRRE